VDQPPGARLDDVAIGTGGKLRDHDRPGLLGDVTTVEADGYLRRPAAPDGEDPAGGSGATEDWWPYRPASDTGRERWEPVTLTAIPYLVRGNRDPGAMRVWIPHRDPR
jgi:DUF1680 family protein